MEHRITFNTEQPPSVTLPAVGLWPVMLRNCESRPLPVFGSGKTFQVEANDVAYFGRDSDTGEWKSVSEAEYLITRAL